MKGFSTKTLMGGFALATIVALNMAHVFNHYGYLDYTLNPNVLAQTNSSGGSSGGSSSGGGTVFDVYANGQNMKLGLTGSKCIATITKMSSGETSYSLSVGGSLGFGGSSVGGSGGTSGGSSSGVISSITYEGNLHVCVDCHSSFCQGPECIPYSN